MTKKVTDSPTQHANATTTPEMRVFIHESDLPTAMLARLLKVSESTIRKWRKRTSLTDASHVPKQLNTTLSAIQEYAVVELRTRLLLPLDELLLVCKKFINAGVSRAGLQRCLKRHGVSRLANMEAIATKSSEDTLKNSAPVTVQVVLEDTKAHKKLVSDLSPKAMHEVLNCNNQLDENEVVQVSVTQLPDFLWDSKNEHNAYRLLIASDPTSGWVYVDIYNGNESEAACRYMSYVLTKGPFHIRRMLAENYNEFLRRFRLLNESPDEATTLFSSQNFHDTER